MNEELNEWNVSDKAFCFPDEFQAIWKSQTCRINSFINSWERVKILVCEFGILDIFHDAWKGNIVLHDWVLQQGLGDSPYWWSERTG